MSTLAARERAALANLLAEKGPNSPTLCEGWQTKDLALHLIERDSRPDILAGLALSGVPILGSKARAAHADLASQPWEALVARVAQPTGLSPARVEALDKRMNGVEFFVHHEDVRRAQSEWDVRDLGADAQKQLWSILSTMGKLLIRKHEGTVVLAAEGYGSMAGGSGASGEVTVVRGEPSELVLWAFGRDEKARVEVTDASN